MPVSQRFYSAMCGVVAAYCVMCIIYQHANAVWTCDKKGCAAASNFHANLNLVKYTSVFFGSVLMVYRDDPRRTHAAAVLLGVGVVAFLGQNVHWFVVLFKPHVTLIAQLLLFAYGLSSLVAV